MDFLDDNPTIIKTALKEYQKEKKY